MLKFHFLDFDRKVLMEPVAFTRHQFSVPHRENPTLTLLNRRLGFLPEGQDQTRRIHSYVDLVVGEVGIILFAYVSDLF